MHETGKQLLNLMFKQGEAICVSPNKYGYHSIPLEKALDEDVQLLSTDFREGKPLEQCLQTCPSADLQLVALNPIQGWRDDVSCKSYRNFLVELDYGPLAEQLAYVKRLEMPYSAVVFSGGKSLHFLVSLAQDLPDEKSWRKVSEWILAIVTLADQNTKNPSRSIRIPGAKRDDKKQLLVEFKGPVVNQDLGVWLSRYPDAAPREQERKPLNNLKSFPKMKPWMVRALKEGFDVSKGRNKQWFAIACEFALHGFSEDETMDILGEFFLEDRDFKGREWRTAIRSAFKYIYENRKTT